MKWNRYRLKIRDDAEDIVISALADAGVQGVEIEDAVPLSESELSQMFVDIPPAQSGEEGVAYLSFYLDPASEDVAAVLARVRDELDALRAFCEIGEGTIEESETENADWENEWKKYFKPFWIDDIYVLPSWAEDDFCARVPERGKVPDPCWQKEGEALSKMTLRIDPGTAFGTGMHETTQLCIRQLRKHMPAGARVLDIGTGSGILGILAWKFGASHILGTDLDPNVETAAAENCAANGVPYGGRIDLQGGEDIAKSGAAKQRGFFLLLGDIADDPGARALVEPGACDIVLTNILADVLVKMAPTAARALAPGGVWITSGILVGRELDVAAAAEAAGLQVEEVTQQGEWMSVTARKL